ncbi:MAG: GntR family transcriptional regulator [Firmicutes bacterium]|nr:GntR family transcriptional regulator [Bacillota bacterium]
MTKLSTNPLDDNQPVPLYYQLYQRLRNSILNGDFSEGEYIPSESELSELYGVSRTTVRQAVLELVREGLLERRRGKGTIVKSPLLTRESPGWMSFTEEMLANHRHPGSKTLSFEVIDSPDYSVFKALQLTKDESIVRIVRSRFADGVLLGISISFLRQSLWNQLGISEDELDNKSLYAILEDKLGIKLTYATEDIRAILPTKEIMQLVKVPANQPMLLIARVAYNSNGTPIEHGTNIFRGDLYNIKLMHKRAASEGEAL